MLHEDLLDQATLLATIDSGRPRQANLRRAISSSYYAVFHALIGESCRAILGTQHGQLRYRNVLGRAFTHGAMKDACNSFGGGTLKSHIQKGLPPNFVILTENRTVANLFVELQDKRHGADYDLNQSYQRSDVLALIEETRNRLQPFLALPNSNEKQFFLISLLAWKELSNR